MMLIQLDDRFEENGVLRRSTAYTVSQMGESTVSSNQQPKIVGAWSSSPQPRRNDTITHNTKHDSSSNDGRRAISRKRSIKPLSEGTKNEIRRIISTKETFNWSTPWLQWDCSRDDAIFQLQQPDVEDGTFIVRQSVTRPNAAGVMSYRYVGKQKTLWAKLFGEKRKKK